MGNCNQFCNPNTKKNNTSDERQIDASETVKLKCQLCHHSIEHTSFKAHLDCCHIAFVTQSIRQSGLQVHCMLCQFQTISLEAHQRHLNAKHKYMEKYLKKNRKDEEKGVNLQTHENIRKRVQKVTKFDFKILKKNKNIPSLAEYNDENYDLIINEKEYGAMEYLEERAEADVVWRYIFEDYPQAVSYAMTFEPEQKTIKVTGYILFPHRNR